MRTPLPSSKARWAAGARRTPISAIAKQLRAGVHAPPRYALRDLAPPASSLTPPRRYAPAALPLCVLVLFIRVLAGCIGSHVVGDDGDPLADPAASGCLVRMASSGATRLAWMATRPAPLGRRPMQRSGLPRTNGAATCIHTLVVIHVRTHVCIHTLVVIHVCIHTYSKLVCIHTHSKLVCIHTLGCYTRMYPYIQYTCMYENSSEKYVYTFFFPEKTYSFQTCMHSYPRQYVYTRRPHPFK